MDLNMCILIIRSFEGKVNNLKNEASNFQFFFSFTNITNITEWEKATMNWFCHKYIVYPEPDTVYLYMSTQKVF